MVVIVILPDPLDQLFLINLCALFCWTYSGKLLLLLHKIGRYLSIVMTFSWFVGASAHFLEFQLTLKKISLLVVWSVLRYPSCGFSRCRLFNIPLRVVR